MGSRESWLETGLVVLGAALLVGLGALMLGRATGSAQQGRRFAQRPPSEGQVPASRHQHISSAAAR